MKKIYLLFIFSLSVFLKSFSQEANPKIIFYEDTTKFSSLEEVLNLPELKNKVVYFDLWGTRCIPCLEEFKHMKSLKEHYKNKAVAFVYLKSPYGFDDSKEWKELVNKNNLEGLHISMYINFYTHNFWIKYQEKYTEERQYAIPTYLIANRKGVIVNFDASRPSKPEKLIKEIDKEL